MGDESGFTVRSYIQEFHRSPDPSVHHTFISTVLLSTSMVSRGPEPLEGE